MENLATDGYLYSCLCTKTVHTGLVL
jgi:hypothetical protein